MSSVPKRLRPILQFRGAKAAPAYQSNRLERHPTEIEAVLAADPRHTGPPALASTIRVTPVDQYRNLIPNCKMRMWPLMFEINPKVAGWLISVPGPAKFGWLSRLKDSNLVWML
jgi:hypothetical protein